jgi:hypothetical protein
MVPAGFPGGAAGDSWHRGHSGGHGFSGICGHLCRGDIPWRDDRSTRNISAVYGSARSVGTPATWLVRPSRLPGPGPAVVRPHRMAQQWLPDGTSPDVAPTGRPAFTTADRRRTATAGRYGEPPVGSDRTAHHRPAVEPAPGNSTGAHRPAAPTRQPTPTRPNETNNCRGGRIRRGRRNRVDSSARPAPPTPLGSQHCSTAGSRSRSSPGNTVATPKSKIGGTRWADWTHYTAAKTKDLLRSGPPALALSPTQTPPCD